MSSTTYKTLIMQENYDSNNTPFTPLITQIDRVTGCLTVITEQIIDELEGLEILSPSNLVQVYDESDLVGSNNKYFVLYNMGHIIFSSNLVGVEILIKFGGKGSLYLDASRVATVINSNGLVVETLHDVITEARTALDLIKTANDLVALDTIIKADISNAQSVCTALENDTVVAEGKRVQLNTSTTNAIAKKTELDASVVTANNKNVELNNMVTNGETLKTNLNTDINIGDTLHSTLETDISTGNTLHADLNTSITTGGTLNTDLGTKISTGNTLKTDLDSRIVSGGTVKTNLDTSITNGNTSKTNLDLSTTTANTSKTNLDSSIVSANTTKTNLESVIATADTITYATKGEVNAKANTVQEAWIAPTMVNSWVDFGGSSDTIGYMKDTLGFVHLKGTVKGGTAITIFTLPTGYRPVLDKNLNFSTNIGATPSFVKSTGLVGITTLGSNTYVSMDCVIFKAEQ